MYAKGQRVGDEGGSFVQVLTDVLPMKEGFSAEFH
jgi:hypothetical protein